MYATRQQITPLLLFCAAMLAVSARSAAALDWVPGAVRLSDGKLVEGQVCIVNDRVIIMNEEQKRRYSVRTVEMARFQIAVEKQSMEEKWIFKESGLDDKVYLGEFYPVRHYMTTVTFHDGKKISGHMIPATLHVKTEDGKQRFILRRKDEGKVGQKPEDLLYVEDVTFGGEGLGVRGTIRGTLTAPEGEMLQRVVCLNRTNYLSLEGTLDKATGAFRFDDCTRGTYDLIALTDRSIYLYFSRETDKGARRADRGTVNDINKWQAALRDFFHKREIVYAGGSESQLFGLARMERYGGTTSRQAQQVRRYEIWAMSKPGREWQIEQRFYVDRTASPEAEIPRRSIHINKGLGGHEVTPENEDLELQLTLGCTDEPLIPPTPPKEDATDVH